MVPCVTVKALTMLILLTFQNTAAVVLLKFVRMRKELPQPHSGCVLMLQELSKLVASTAWCFYDVWESGTSQQRIDRESHAEESLSEKGDFQCRGESTAMEPSTRRDWRGVLKGVTNEIFAWGAFKLVIPSAMFSLQNAVFFVAMANLEPTMFLALYQSKVLITGMLMVTVLGRTFSAQKWTALVVLFGGIVLTQYNPSASKLTGAENTYTGVAAVFVCSTASSLGGVVMEKLMKSSTRSHLSTQNIHLSFFSLLFVGIPAAFRVWASIDVEFISVLYGVDGVVWLMILNQAVGGLLGALCLRHSDNILKTFSTACAIVVGGVVSHFLFGFVPSAVFLLGSFIVGFAILMYGLPDVF